MRRFWLLTVTLCILSSISAQQNGYNYPQPQKPFDTSAPSSNTGYPSETHHSPTGNLPSSSSQQSKPAASSFNGYPSGRPTAAAPGGYPSGPAAAIGSTASTGGFGSQKSGNNGGFQSPSGYQNQHGQGSQQGGNAPGFSPTGGGPTSGGVQSSDTHFGGGNQNGGSLGPDHSNDGRFAPEENEGDLSAIPGTPDVDYPILSSIPETSFSCDQQQYPGYYADVETRCQVFHVCANNKTYNFLCPNGTIFHQEYLVCVWWNQFDCESATSLYSINANLNNEQSLVGSGTGTIPIDGGAGGGNYESQHNGVGYPSGSPSDSQSHNGGSGRQPTDSTAGGRPTVSNAQAGGSQQRYPQSTSNNSQLSPSDGGGQGAGGSRYLPPQHTASTNNNNNNNNNGYPSQGNAGGGQSSISNGSTHPPSREYLPPIGAGK